MPFVEKKRKAKLRAFGVFVRFVGWSLIVYWAIDLICACVYWHTENAYLFSESSISQIIWSGLRNELIPGVLALGVAEFLRFYFDQEGRFGMFLRFSPLLLTISAFIYFVQLVMVTGALSGVISEASGFVRERSERAAERREIVKEVGGAVRDDKLTTIKQEVFFVSFLTSMLLGSLLMLLARIIFLFGLAEVMRRVLPIIDESKSMV